jgi:hypothetical protein
MAATLTNISQWVSGGFAKVQFAKSSSGLPYDAANLPAQGAGVGMTDVGGASAADVSFGEAIVQQIQGDDGVRGAITFPSQELPTFSLTTADFTMSLANTLQGTTTDDAQSVYDFFILDPADRQFTDVFIMLTRQSVSTEAGSTGSGYESVIFPLCDMTYQGPSGFQTGPNAGSHSFTITIKTRVSQLPWGETLTTGAHGTTGASGFMFWSESIPTFDVYRQDGSTTAYTPTKSLATNEQVIGWNDVTGTIETLSTSVSSGDFTFTAATADELSVFLYERI